MKLYYAKGTCSLADHIAFVEAGLTFKLEKVDLRTKKTETGADFNAINPKGYVPALILDSGEMLTENIAILDWVAHRHTALRPSGEMGHSRLIEALAFISTEIHQQYGTFYTGGTDEQKAQATEAIKSRIGLLADTMDGDFLFGAKVSAADFLLFVMLLWAKKIDIALGDKIDAYRERMLQLPSVRQAMKDEGML